MLDKLFKFPIIMVDPDEEERRKKLDLPSDDGEYEIIEGEAEYPYYDFVGVEDRWIPNADSREKSKQGKFEACAVRFANVGQFLVPWSKSKFKKELQKFVDELLKNDKGEEEEGMDMTVIRITPDQLTQILKGKGDEKEE